MYRILSRGALVVGALVISSLALPLAAQELKDDPKWSKGTRAVIKQLLAKAEQEYQVFFKKPVEVVDFWAAINFELSVGKFDIAALHLDQLLNKQPADKVDAELLKIEDAEGFSTFLRFQNVRKWSDNPDIEKHSRKNADTLIARVTAALDKHLGDPERLKKFIDNLSAPEPEVRAYAFAQLERARGRAAPYLVAELRRTAGKLEQSRILDAMVKLPPDIVPPLLEALNARSRKDAEDADLRLALLDVIRRRGDRRAVPYLWHLSAAPKYPVKVRAAATATLAYLLERDVEALTPAKIALTRQAEELYRHKVRFLDPKRILIWRWTDEHKLDPKAVELKASQYEEIFATRYLKQALELDPAYRPAQILFLSLTLERAYDGKLDQLLMGKTAPALDQLLLTVDADLVLEVLERALAEHNLAVILPAIRALGQRGEFRAAGPGTQGAAGPVVRALYYPDRRVQFAAANALLAIPSEPVPANAGRVVEVLRRFVAASPSPKVLVAFAPNAEAAALRKQVKAAGFEPVLTADLKTTFAELHRAADVDAILLHPSVPENELPYLVAQLRADADVGLTPLLLITPAPREAALARLAGRYRNVWLLPEVYLKDADELKTRLEDAIKLAAAPDAVLQAPPRQRAWLDEEIKRSKGQKLTDPERKQLAAKSLEALWAMSRGILKGYDLRPAEATLVDALANDDMTVPALEILATFSGLEPQQRLAGLVVDPSKGKMRVAAAVALNRSVQAHGLSLNRDQVAQLRRIQANPAEDATLRAQLAPFVGNLRTTPAATGSRLSQFNPNAPPAK